MAKRRRSSRKRTSRRNSGLAQLTRRHEAQRASDLVASWKRSYVSKHGNAAGLARIAEQSTARLHELIDEGVPLKQAYTETVHFFNQEKEQYLADFADDTAHKMYLLVKESGLSPTAARVAVLAGADRPVANTRRRRSRRARR